MYVSDAQSAALDREFPQARKQLPLAPSTHLKDGQGEGVRKLLLVLQDGLPVAPHDINAGDGVQLGVDPVQAAAGKI